jgi:hypothetical protein
MIETETPVLIDHISGIISLSRKLGTGNDFFTAAAVHLDAVEEKLGLSKNEALIFAFFLNEFGGEPAALSNLAKSLKWENIDLYRRMKDIENLEKKKFIRGGKYRGALGGRRRETAVYYVPVEVIGAVTRDEPFLPAGYNNLSSEGIFSALEALFEQLESRDMYYENFLFEAKDLLGANLHVDFAGKLLALDLSGQDFVLFLYIIHRLVNNDGSLVKYSDVSHIFAPCMASRIVRTLKNGTNPLIEQGLIENRNEGGFGNPDMWVLSDKTLNTILAGLELADRQIKQRKDITPADDITEKRLYFNKPENERIEKLLSLLSPEKFEQVEERLKQNGLRQGFACLFYGAPGTGKTETALQLARATGRDIMKVNAADMKSKWFGDSEKLVKNLFVRYRALVEEYRHDKAPVPVLLFNEADAVIGKRRELGGARNGPDQTENAIQNIILEEIENLQGIIIATTNLTKNMDAAFERRFLYKIEFGLPEKETRGKIWKNQIPRLAEHDAALLAGRFRFSGGQIENISRKYVVDLVLNGLDPSLERLVQYCEDETLGRETPAIGFSA